MFPLPLFIFRLSHLENIFTKQSHYKILPLYLIKKKKWAWPKSYYLGNTWSSLLSVSLGACGSHVQPEKYPSRGEQGSGQPLYPNHHFSRSRLWGSFTWFSLASQPCTCFPLPPTSSTLQGIPFLGLILLVRTNPQLPLQRLHGIWAHKAALLEHRKPLLTEIRVHNLSPLKLSDARTCPH